MKVNSVTDVFIVIMVLVAATILLALLGVPDWIVNVSGVGTILYGFYLLYRLRKRARK